MFKAIAAIGTLLMVAIIVGVGWWAFHGLAGLVNTAAREQKSAILAQTAAAQAQAGASAQRIVIAGQARQHLDLTVHQEVANAIDQTAGADTPLGPAMARTLYDGMCDFPHVRAGGGCAQVRPADPGPVAGADTAP